MNLWHISEDSFKLKKMRCQETVYTIGNGYFATRGTFEENYFGANPGTLLYGVFDDIPIGKEELANIPDWLPIQLFINGERFHMTRGKILAYHRTLDMRNGVLTPAGSAPDKNPSAGKPSVSGMVPSNPPPPKWTTLPLKLVGRSASTRISGALKSTG